MKLLLLCLILLIPLSSASPDTPVTFNTTTTVCIGEFLTIKGSVNTTGTVDITIEDTLYPILNDIPIKNKNFSKKIDTSKYSEFQKGYITLKAYVNRTSPDNIEPNERCDGLTAIIVTNGSLTAKTSTTIVSPGSDFTISGTAKGSKTVDILIISPDGNHGECIDPTATTIDSTNIYYKSPIVSNDDNKYSVKVTTGDDIDTGSYLIIVLAKGDDNKYGNTHNNLSDALSGYSFSHKLQDQLLAMIKDATYGAVASDDFYWIGHIRVASEAVVLDNVPDVEVGDPLKITGTSSKKDGYSVLIMVIGQTMFPPQTAKILNNRFNTTFNTTDVKIGDYIIEADDGDGHTDKTTMNIIPKSVITPTPTPVEEPTPSPTVVKPTPTVDKPEPKPSPIPTLRVIPGFEVLVTVLSLLVVTYYIKGK